MPVVIEGNEERQSMIAEALWQTLVLAYKPPGDRSKNAVPIPAQEAAGAFMICIAQVIAMIPDSAVRHAMITQAGPLIGKIITDSRSPPPPASPLPTTPVQ